MPNATPACGGRPLQKYTVLSVGRSTVEFERRNRFLLDAGFRVLEATTAGEAISRASVTHPSAVVIGHRIPIAERMEIMREIRRPHGAIPVILMYDGKIDGAEMADAILNVKGDPGDLIQTVQYLLSRPRRKSDDE